MSTGVSALVADGDPAARQMLRMCLEGECARVLGVATPSGALEALDRARFDLVVLDSWLGATSGLALLPEIRRRQDCDVVVTGAASLPAAVEAIKLGAADYLPKPISPEQVRAALRRVVDGRLHERASVELSDAPVFLATKSPRFEAFLRAAERAAAADCALLLRGESGTGKNVLARWIHERSPRRDAPFVVVHGPALAGDLMASALFGHRRGAFTGAVSDVAGKVHEAEGGTLFLDEVGDLGPDAQARLLRFLNDRTYERVGEAREQRADVRIVAATHRDLPALARAGTFREDLLYRLDVVTLTLPPLRERREDVLPLAEHWLRAAAVRHGRYDASLSPEAVFALEAHAFPGNLRELRHAIERAVILAPTASLGPADLGIEPVPAAPPPTLGGDATLDEIEREHVARVVARAPSLEAAARALGIDATTLQRKRRRYGLA